MKKYFENFDHVVLQPCPIDMHPGTYENDDLRLFWLSQKLMPMLLINHFHFLLKYVFLTKLIICLLILYHVQLSEGGERSNSRVGCQICLIPSKGELFLGQTIIKVEPNKVKWVMEFTPPTFRYGGA